MPVGTSLWLCRFWSDLANAAQPSIPKNVKGLTLQNVRVNGELMSGVAVN